MLQTRSAHILVLVSAFTIAMSIVWSIEEIEFASNGDSLPIYLLAIVSHLCLPCTLLPLIFRGQAFLIMLNPTLRKKYVRFIRKRMSLLILGALICLTGILPFGLHIAGYPSYFDMNQNKYTIGANLFFGEWRYFLPLFVVYIVIQSIQLYYLTIKSRVEDTLGIVSELKFVLATTITFTLVFFTWLICLDEGVHVSSFSVQDNHDWMRLNHLVMLFQICIYSRCVVKPLYQVYAHTQQQTEKASLYADRGKWLKGPASNDVVKIRVAPDGKTPRPTKGNTNLSEEGGEGKNSSRVSGGARGPLQLLTESPATSTNHRATNSFINDGSSPSPYSTSASNWQHGTLSAPTVNTRNRLKSLRDILLHDASRALFCEFAQKHLCLESVMFFLAVEQYQSHPGWNGLDLKKCMNSDVICIHHSLLQVVNSK